MTTDAVPPVFVCVCIKCKKSMRTVRTAAVRSAHGRLFFLTVPFPAVAADGHTGDGISGDP